VARLGAGQHVESGRCGHVRLEHERLACASLYANAWQCQIAICMKPQTQPACGQCAQTSAIGQVIVLNVMGSRSSPRQGHITPPGPSHPVIWLEGCCSLLYFLMYSHWQSNKMLRGKTRLRVSRKQCGQESRIQWLAQMEMRGNVLQVWMLKKGIEIVGLGSLEFL
jgi:hypothetical protein